MLTTKKQRFIEAYDDNATQDALLAGYSQKTAYSKWQENLKKPEIQQAIHEREQSRLNGLIDTRDERLTFLTGVMRNTKHDIKNRLRACELLDKAEGDFLERVEVKTQETLDLGGEIKLSLLELEKTARSGIKQTE